MCLCVPGFPVQGRTILLPLAASEILGKGCSSPRHQQGLWGAGQALHGQLRLCPLRLPPVPSSDSLLCKGSCFGLGFRILRLWSLKKLTGELKIELLLGRNSVYPKWPPENSFPKWNLGFLSWCHLDKNWLLQVMRSSWTPDGGRCRECPEFC